MTSQPIDLGDGVTATTYRCTKHPDGECCGVFVRFADGCRSGFGWCDQARPRWDVQSRDPLTLSPSLKAIIPAWGDLDPEHLNREPHEHHGFIRGGRWVSE